MDGVRQSSARPRAKAGYQGVRRFAITGPTADARKEARMAAYDPDNIFAKILKGEIPCHKLYEDE